MEDGQSLNELLNIAREIGPYIGYGIAGLLALGGFYTVDQKHEGLVSRFSKYTGTPKKAGLHWKIPFIDQVDTQVTLAQQAVEALLDTKTIDNQFIALPISIHLNVTDSAKFYYDNEDSLGQIKTIVSAEVRKYTSGKTFQEIYDDREEISAKVIENVTKDIEGFGVHLNQVIVDEPRPDEEVQKAYNRVKASEREKEAAENEAAAKYILAVKAAEADKRRSELTGEGVAAFRQSIAKSYKENRKELIDAGVDEDKADALMEVAMRLDTLRDIGREGNTIVMDLDNKSGNSQVFAQVVAALKAKGITIPPESDAAAPSSVEPTVS